MNPPLISEEDHETTTDTELRHSQAVSGTDQCALYQLNRVYSPMGLVVVLVLLLLCCGLCIAAGCCMTAVDWFGGLIMSQLGPLDCHKGQQTGLVGGSISASYS
jgi:hypothetical protein